jgi:hypothetical protein
MNAIEAGAIITEAAQSIGAHTFTPAQWGDRNSDAYAVVLSPHHCVVMVRTDDLQDGHDVTAYKYATPRGVAMLASDIMPALMADDGASLDPTASGTVTITDSDSRDAIYAATRSAIRLAIRS